MGHKIVRRGEAYNSEMLQPAFALLRAEVDQARAGYTQAKQTFWHVSAQPHSEPNDERILAAARAQTEAMITYTRALRRFNAYLLEGTIPEDIRIQQGMTRAAGGA